MTVTPPEEPPIIPRPQRSCASHPDEPTTSACEECGRWVCAKCRAIVLGQTRCRSCPSPGQRVPLPLRLAVHASWMLLVPAVAYRVHLVERLYAGSGALWHKAAVFPPVSVFGHALPSVRWEHVFAIEDSVQRGLDGWGVIIVIAVLLTALYYALRESDASWATFWRILVAVLGAGATLIIRADSLWNARW
jgi:hypothetical protein